MTQERRKFLAGLLGGAAGASLARLGLMPAFAREPGELTVVGLTDDLVQLSGAGGNVVARKGADGLVLVDSGAPEDTYALLGFIATQLGGARIEALLNTHWHLAHTGGNEALGGAGARIFAHENTRLWMSTEFYVAWEDKTYPPRPKTALPTETFYSSDPQPLELDVGGRAIQYAHMRQAHTDGDIYVLFPDDDVLVGGDVVAVGAYPTPDYVTGGWIGGLIDATRTLLDLSAPTTRIVPGKGPVQSRAHLQSQYEMLTTVRERIESSMRRGKSAEEMLAEGVTKEFDPAWGDPALFVSNVYDGLWWGGRLGNSL